MQQFTLPEASPMLGPPKRRDLDRPVVASLEVLVAKDNLYRHIEKVLDLSFVRDWVKECYAERGRPSVDPIAGGVGGPRKAGHHAFSGSSSSG